MTMEKVFYGVSMGLINPEAKSYTQNFYVFILRQLIEEFEQIEAELLLLRNNEREVLVGDKIDELLSQGYFVFSFRKEEYFSDVKKTCELVVESVAKKVLDRSKGFKDKGERARVIENFKTCFKAYYTERELPISISREQIFNEVSSAVKELVSQGRSIPVATKPSMIALLSEPGLEEILI